MKVILTLIMASLFALSAMAQSASITDSQAKSAIEQLRNLNNPSSVQEITDLRRQHMKMMNSIAALDKESIERFVNAVEEELSNVPESAPLNTYLSQLQKRAKGELESRQVSAPSPSVGASASGSR